MRKKIQLIEKEINVANAIVRITEDVDQNYKYLKGIAILHGIGQGHLLRSCTIDGSEILPKNFEVAFLQSTTGVAPKDRFFPLKEISNGAKIEIDFQDATSAETEYPYILKIYLELSND